MPTIWLEHHTISEEKSHYDHTDSFISRNNGPKSSMVLRLLVDWRKEHCTSIEGTRPSYKQQGDIAVVTSPRCLQKASTESGTHRWQQLHLHTCAIKHFRFPCSRSTVTRLWQQYLTILEEKSHSDHADSFLGLKKWRISTEDHQAFQKATKGKYLKPKIMSLRNSPSHRWRWDLKFARDQIQTPFARFAGGH